MVHTRRDGRALVTVSPDSAAILNGEVDISQWDDEELAYGRRRDKNERFSGKPPVLIPTECVRELNRRKLFETNSIIRNACTDAATYLAAVTRGEETPVAGRIKATEIILDRFMGKPKERIEMEHDIKEPAWIGVMRRALSIDGQPVSEHPITRDAVAASYTRPIPATSRAVEEDDGIIDAELVEDDDEILWDDDDPVLTDG